ncbi:MAG: GNAT family N-acetyltransferase [Clostridia bacterium]|nr:GNAT family N-acetyltransferase [Clostridia bacterium]
MEVRYIKPEEAADFQKVSAASFIWKFNAEEDSTVKVPVLAAFDEEKLIAGVEILDYKVNYCGKFIGAVEIDGVCSQPECRRMGGVRAIFDRIGEIAEENDWILGFLHPFSIEYYGKFGYANLNRMFEVKVPFEKLGHIPRNTDVILYTGEQFEELSSLHEKCALRENLMTLRDEKKHFCNKPLENADYTYFRRNADGNADGYVRFKVNRPNDVVVEEFFVLSPEALIGLVGFLRNYDGIAKNLVVSKQYQGSDFACLADGIDGVRYEFSGSTAARIYNLKGLLESNEYPCESGRFSLLSLDEIERNKGIFDVEYANGKAIVTQRNDGDYDIALTASAAARLMLAGEGHTADTAAYIKGVEIKGNADGFFKAFPKRATRFADNNWSE